MQYILLHVGILSVGYSLVTSSPLFFNMVWRKWRQRDDVHRLTSPHFPFAGARLISFNTEPVVDRRSCEGTWSINNDARDRHVESLLFWDPHNSIFLVCDLYPSLKRKRFGCFLNKINVLKKNSALSLITSPSTMVD